MHPDYVPTELWGRDRLALPLQTQAIWQSLAFVGVEREVAGLRDEAGGWRCKCFGEVADFVRWRAGVMRILWGWCEDCEHFYMGHISDILPLGSPFGDSHLPG